MGIKTVVLLKQYVTDTGIFDIIISEFSYKKEPSQIVLIVIDKNSEINLYYTILFFRLSIHLGVEDSKELLLNSKEIAW